MSLITSCGSYHCRFAIFLLSCHFSLRQGIVYHSIYFCRVQGIIPNAEEMAVLEELTNELFETLPPENDTVLPDPEPPTGQQDLIDFRLSHSNSVFSTTVFTNNIIDVASWCQYQDNYVE